jgi:hypothetical protein
VSGGAVTARLWGVGCLLAVLALASACSTADAAGVDPAARQPPQPPQRGFAPVSLGATQRVDVANGFGPGTADVSATVTVYAFRDHVAARSAVPPITPGTHWASADVRVCRAEPVVLGYPAWVLGDDSGRTAQETRVLHAAFPQPAFPDRSTSSGCARGWVTWVTPDGLKATQVTFEQTRAVPGPWRIR